MKQSSWPGTPLVLAMGVYDDTAIEGICSRLRVPWWRWSVSTFSWCSNFNISCCCCIHSHGFLWKSLWALLNLPCFLLWLMLHLSASKVLVQDSFQRLTCNSSQHMLGSSKSRLTRVNYFYPLFMYAVVNSKYLAMAPVPEWTTMVRWA